jgi:epoxyqueuosine reductase QueG
VIFDAPDGFGMMEKNSALWDNSEKEKDQFDCSAYKSLRRRFMDQQNTPHELKAAFIAELLTAGAWRVGVADLSVIPEEQRKSFPLGISIIVKLDLSVINSLGHGVSQQYYDMYEKANEQLDILAEKAVSILERQGFRAFAQTRKNVRSGARSRTLLPHKTVATRAGIGWIGKSALLVTSDLGGAVRLTSVLTDAPFEPDEPVTASRCGDCRECERNCPGGAISGNLWTPESNREDFYHMEACRVGCLKRAWNVKPGMCLCGVCIISCPYTRKAIEREGILYDFPAVEIALKQDIPEILELQKKSFMPVARQYGLDSIPPTRQTYEEILEECFSPDRPGIMLKLVLDGKIVGSVRAYEQDGTAYINKLMVDPDYQRRGFAKKLMMAIESCYGGRRKELFTGSKSEGNIRLYESLGYFKYSEKIHDEKTTLVYMEKV